MDRHSNNTSGMSEADALLQQLKNDLLQNEGDREAIAAEEAAAKHAATRRYRFRVMKKAEYLEKKKIAETIASAADDADISDEDLEALLRNYLKDTPRANPVIENTTEIISVTPKEPKTSEKAPKIDLDQPLSKKEPPFFEELDEEEAIETQAELSDDLIISLADELMLADTAETANADDIVVVETEDISVAVTEAESEAESDDEDGLLAADPMLDDTFAALLDDFDDAPEAVEEFVSDDTQIAADDVSAEAAVAETDETVDEADDDLMALLAAMDEDDASLFDQFEDVLSAETTAEPTAAAADTEDDEIPLTITATNEHTNTSISDEELESMLAALEAEDELPVTVSSPDEDLYEAPVATEDEPVSPQTAQDDVFAAFSTDTVDDDLPSEEDIAAMLAGLADDEEDFPADTAKEAVVAEPVAAVSVPSDDDLSDDDLAAVLADIPDDMLTDLPDDIPVSINDTDAATDGDDLTADDLFALLQTDAPTADAGTEAATEPEAAQTAPIAEAETAAEPAPVSEHASAAPAEDEFDQTDLDLMIAFGMEDQIEKAVGSEKAKKYKQAIGERGEGHYNEMHMGDRPDTVLDKHAEYVSAAQNREIFAEYKKKYSAMLFRFLGALFFLILLFFFENDKLLGINLPAIVNREQYPLVYTLVDLQLVVLSGAMIRKGIRTGIRAIFRGRPVPESITGFLFIACLVYTAVIASLCPMHGLQLYNFPIALAVLFALCYEFMNLRREIMSFKIVSSKKLKYAVDAISPKDGEAEKRMFAEYISDDPALFRIKRTAFVENFFARTETYPRTQRILRTVIPAVLLLTLAFFAAAFMLDGSVYGALTAAYITLLLTLPSCAFIMFSYPMYRASGFAYEKESAMIGEASLGEYADASVVTFDDKEVFPSRGVRVRNVKVYGNNRIDHVIYAAASVFHVVGGPLSDVFETATGELGYSEDVKLIRLDRDGIESRVNNDTVLVGRAAFVNRYGYNVTLSESETAMEETGDACILYVAYDNNIAAKLYIQYAVEPDFEVVLKQLYRQGICVGIKTSDPNIDDHLLSCKIKMSKYPVKIIKCAEPKETAIIVDRLSSGIVSKASAKSLLQTLAICDRVLSASRTNNVLGIVSILLAMAAMAFFIISGMSITVAPLFIALYQLFWVIPVIAVARYYI